MHSAHCMCHAVTVASESLSTLKFAQACSNVKNRPRVCQPAQNTTPRPKKKATTVVPWGKECTLPDACGSGKIWVESYGEHQLGEEAVHKTALLLHAEDSSCASMRYIAPCMLHLGHRCIFIDQPGCGNNPGLQVHQATTTVQTTQVSTTRQTVLMNNMVTITYTLSSEKREAATCVHDPTTQAATQFRRLMANPEKLQLMYSGQHNSHNCIRPSSVPYSVLCRCAPSPLYRMSRSF